MAAHKRNSPISEKTEEQTAEAAPLYCVAGRPLFAGLEFIDIVLDLFGALEHLVHIRINKLVILLFVHLILILEVLLGLTHHLIDIHAIETFRYNHFLVCLGAGDLTRYNGIVDACVAAETECRDISYLNAHCLSGALETLGFLTILRHEFVAGLVGTDAVGDLFADCLVGDGNELFV